MTTASMLATAYIIAAVLFILSLRGLSHQESARYGNVYGIVGMIVAIVATAVAYDLLTAPALLGPAAVAAIIGAIVAARVAMTAMPQLVALLHSFVGAAAVLVGISNHLVPGVQHIGADKAIHDVETFLGIFIGAITFTGSIIA